MLYEVITIHSRHADVQQQDIRPLTRGQLQRFMAIGCLATDHAAPHIFQYAAQGGPVDIGGYYNPDEAAATAAMRPSATLSYNFV